MLHRTWLFAFALALACGFEGCAPRAHPLSGTPAPARIPPSALPPQYRQLVFRWSYDDNTIVARGEGVARIAPPDSARLDFFLDGGFGGGHAILIGDTLLIPGGDALRSMLPPPPLLWGALQRLDVPNEPDTVARVDGDTLRADIGRDPVWRVVFSGDKLVAVSLIKSGRVRKWVSRTGARVEYNDEDAHRNLIITISREQDVAPFDSTIWQ